jgi:hypothetical protein
MLGCHLEVAQDRFIGSLGFGADGCHGLAEKALSYSPVAGENRRDVAIASREIPFQGLDEHPGCDS